MIMGAVCDQRERGLNRQQSAGPRPTTVTLTVCGLLLLMTVCTAQASMKEMLLEAATRGSEKEVKLLLELGADVDARDTSGRTPLILACQYSRVSVVKVLIAHGAEINAKDQVGITPLIKVSSVGNRGLVDFLISCGADVRARTIDGRSALHFACERFNVPVARLLLSKGAEVDAETKRGGTPLLHVTCAQCAPRDCGPEQTSLVKLLLNAGADPEVVDVDGYSPLECALKHARPEAVYHILSAIDWD